MKAEVHHAREQEMPPHGEAVHVAASSGKRSGRGGRPLILRARIEGLCLLLPGMPGKAGLSAKKKQRPYPKRGICGWPFQKAAVDGATMRFALRASNE